MYYIMIVQNMAINIVVAKWSLKGPNAFNNFDEWDLIWNNPPYSRFRFSTLLCLFIANSSFKLRALQNILSVLILS